MLVVMLWDLTKEPAYSTCYQRGGSIDLGQIVDFFRDPKGKLSISRLEYPVVLKPAALASDGARGRAGHRLWMRVYVVAK